MKRLFFSLLGLSAVLVAGTLVLVYLVFWSPLPDLSQNQRLNSLRKQSRVYYQDEKNTVGSFSEDTFPTLYVSHPTQIQYTPDSTLPPLFLSALLASADSTKPLIKKVSALLWQYRNTELSPTPTQSQGSQFLENLRLKARYSQEQILELYSNLFEVPSGGRGLGAAAQHYFGKKVSALNLGELAFIASLLQNESDAQPTFQQQKKQRNQVLHNMQNRAFITQKELDQSLESPLQFRNTDLKPQGSVSIPMKWVRQRLKQAPFVKLLQENGIQNLAQAQLKIVTTLDVGLQYISQFELRRHQSRLEFSKHAYQPPSDQSITPLNTALHAGGFYVGRIARIQQTPQSSSILIKVGKAYALVKKGLMDEFVRRVLKRDGSKLRFADYQQALQNLHEGDPIRIALHTQKGTLLSSNSSDNQTLALRPWKASIEQETSINGAVLVLQNSEIRAVVGETLQQKQSLPFPILVYWAALELGWNPLEPLSSQKAVFTGKKQKTTPIWAAATSKSTANSNLFHQLLKYLKEPEFQKLMDFAELLPLPQETPKTYVSRLRNQFQILDVSQKMEARLFQVFHKQMLSEFEFATDAKVALPLPSSGFSSEKDSFQYLGYRKSKSNNSGTRAKKSTSLTQKKRHFSTHNFVQFKKLSQTLEQQRKVLIAAFKKPKQTPAHTLDQALSGFFIQTQFIHQTKKGQSIPPLFYSQTASQVSSEWQRLTRYRFQLYARNWNLKQQQRFFDSENLWIHGSIRLSVIQNLNNKINQKLQKLLSKEAYAPERLYWNQDFRNLLKLKTLTTLGKALGIQKAHTKRASLKELARLYQAFSSGKIQNQQEILIQRIEDAQGKVMYQAKKQTREFLSKKSQQAVQELMRGVVEYGTARSAQSYLSSKRIANSPENRASEWVRIPAYGSPNQSKSKGNSVYVGTLPLIQGAYASPEGAYTIAVHLAGNAASKNRKSVQNKENKGLPVWYRIAYYLIHSRDYQKTLATIPVSKNVVLWPLSFQALHSSIQQLSPKTGQQLSPKTGLPTKGASTQPTVPVYLPKFNPEKERDVSLFSKLSQLKQKL